ncbi:hypothetical protein K492DRAFT_224267 [Lichtheimia hyalospora FSU 10163]|nr:hypothetical protein K492DRAFT_224267 [Lichtheimia hyalospora FSU 10163]
MTPSLSIPKTFANNFWGKEDAGYNVLMHKMNMAKKTCDDLKSFYNTKASLHEDLAKKLLKQTKAELGREETGTLGMLLASTQKQMESSAQAHQELARKIRVELELPLDNFILEQKDKRKLYQTNVDKAHRNKNLHASHVNKAKEKYEAECAKKVSLEHQIASATASKDMDRLQFKVERSKNEIRTLGKYKLGLHTNKEYKDACAKLTDATALWNHEWKIACDRFQEMEEKRVEFLHHSMCIYINILSTTSGQEQESYEQFWKALDVCDPKTDVEKFIDEKGTGNMIPEPPVYVNYFDDPTKTLPRYQVAQFPAGNDETLSNAPLPQTPAVSSSKPKTARRTASYCEPRRRSSQHHPQPKEVPTSVEERKAHLYASGSCRGEYKKPAPASRNQDMDHVDDECIDPRAQVVMAIGNNRFQVDHQQPPASQQQRPKARRRRTMRTSLDMEEAFNDSIRGLLQELGVQRQQANTTNNTTTTTEQEEYHHHPPSQQQQVIWARALYDYHSDHPDDLSIRRGTWLAIVQNDHKDWWVAHKWDESINALQETCGYVASSFVQVVP